MSPSTQDRRRRKAPEEHVSAWHDDLAELQEPSYPPADFATYSEQKRNQLPHHTPRSSQTPGTEVPTEPENTQYRFQDYYVTGSENVNYPSRDYYEPPTANSINTSSVTDGLAAMNLTSIPSIYPPVTPYGSREPSAMSQDQRNDSATPKNLALSRHIRPDATYGWAMKLDPNYQVRDQGFYRLGRSFSILWVDKGSPMPDDASSIRAAILYRKAGLEENIYVRHFVVVEEGGTSKFCKCLPVTSYGGLGHKKKGIELAKHALINSKIVPRKVDGLVSKHLKINLSQGATMADNCLVNFGAVFTIELNIPVKDVGTLDSKSEGFLIHYFLKFNPKTEEEDRELTPSANEFGVTGVGGSKRTGDGGGGYNLKYGERRLAIGYHSSTAPDPYQPATNSEYTTTTESYYGRDWNSSLENRYESAVKFVGKDKDTKVLIQDNYGQRPATLEHASSYTSYSQGHAQTETTYSTASLGGSSNSRQHPHEDLTPRALSYNVWNHKEIEGQDKCVDVRTKGDRPKKQTPEEIEKREELRRQREERARQQEAERQARRKATEHERRKKKN